MKTGLQAKINQACFYTVPPAKNSFYIVTGFKIIIKILKAWGRICDKALCCPQRLKYLL